MIRINLIPLEAVVKEKISIQSVIGIVGLIVFVIAVSFYGRDYLYLQQIKKKLDDVNLQLSKLDAQVKKVEQLENEAKTLQIKNDSIANLAKTRLLYPRFMGHFASIIPPNVWLSNLGTSSRGLELSVSLQATGFDAYAIADFITALESQLEISEVEIGPLQQAEGAGLPGGTKLISFRLTFKYKLNVT